MPEANRRLLRHVASFLRRAARRDAKKRSDVEALGTAFAPCLFRCDNNVTSQSVFTSVATQMVLNFHLVFPECSDEGLAGWVHDNNYVLRGKANPLFLEFKVAFINLQRFLQFFPRKLNIQLRLLNFIIGFLEAFDNTQFWSSTKYVACIFSD